MKECNKIGICALSLQRENRFGMSNYITDIHIEDLRHLHGIEIPLSKNERRHLLITGKNGSGKTTLLDGIANYLDTIVNVSSSETLSQLEKGIKADESNLKFAMEHGDSEGAASAKERIAFYKKRKEELYSKVRLDFVDEAGFKEGVKSGDVIIAYYRDDRNPQFIEPKSPELPDYKIETKLIRKARDNQFLKLLVHYKVQGAMEGLEGNGDKAGSISEWFDKFTKILRKLFCDEKLELSFNPRDYTFTMRDADGKSFKFTQLPAGYRAALDIISDLILKMQSKGQVNMALDQEGVVLIDEVETHLHLAMQKEIMPILTTVFPKIQFIVSTHSPFVLSSIENADAVDLEKPKNMISDLTSYSYEALAEGYFGITSESSDIQDRLNELEGYVKADHLKERDAKRRDRLIADFERVPEALAPTVVGRFKEIMVLYHSKNYTA